ncbi:uncharacterized protein LOC144198894 [Stigmatopora nigra]
MFPTFRKSDDPRTFPFISPIVQTAPKIGVLGITKGAPYRHDIFETPTRAKTALRNGEFNFSDRPKPVWGVRHALYAAPTMAVLPRPKGADRELTAAERTSNMLKRMDKLQWVTSYQTEYKGSPQYDMREKKVAQPRRTSQTAPLGPDRDRAVMVLVPSKLRQEARRRKGRNLKSPHSEGYLNPSLTKLGVCLCKKASPQPTNTKETKKEVAESLRNNQVERKEGPRVHFEDRLTSSLATNNQKSNMSRLRLPGISPVVKASRENIGLDLRSLQAAYSKTKAHQIFNDSIKYSSINLRDNVYTGKKHSFYGVNSNIIH